tara:strand:+ start:164 stop:1036 length:873 start_codon:yes stop_codon:yes gene_type:complete
MSSKISASRARAAAENTCTTLAIFDDEHILQNVIPEMKDTAEAMKSVLAGYCKCGNANPTRRFVVCGTHLACEMCYEDKEQNVNKQGKCAERGCNCAVVWPAVEVPAFQHVQECAKKACETFAHALQVESQKDVNEGARRRAEALGRGTENAISENEMELADSEPNPLQMSPAKTNRKRKTKSECTEEEWAVIQEQKKQRADERKKKADEKHQKIVDGAKAEGREEAKEVFDQIIREMEERVSGLEARKALHKNRVRGLTCLLKEMGATDQAITARLRRTDCIAGTIQEV